MEICSPSITSNWLESMKPLTLANNAPGGSCHIITNSESGGTHSPEAIANKSKRFWRTDALSRWGTCFSRVSSDHAPIVSFVMQFLLREKSCHFASGQNTGACPYSKIQTKHVLDNIATSQISFMNYRPRKPCPCSSKQGSPSRSVLRTVLHHKC